MNLLKQQVFEQFSGIARAVAHPVRLELIELLAQGEKTVDRLATALSVPIANASHHLRALRAARLVDTRKAGTFVFYRLSGEDVFELTRMIRTLGERRLAEVNNVVKSYFSARDELEPVGLDELLERARAGEIVLLDARPPEDYLAGHIAGALSVPVEELEHRLADLPRDKEIIAYCRGPYCVMALDAVRKLRANGLAARRFVDGFPEWRAAGLPVETSETYPGS